MSEEENGNGMIDECGEECSSLPPCRPQARNKRDTADCRILVVGAGGLGCEILKGLALAGFKDIHIIDMDTIELTNLNRQFLFRDTDVNGWKAEVAANAVGKRVPGCQIVPHTQRIEEMTDAFYDLFDIIVCGLDNVPARVWMSNKVVEMVKHDAEGKPMPDTVIPLIDGGTEGLKGNLRVIIPYHTPCISCDLSLFSAEVVYAVCTLHSIPRAPEHCAVWAKMVLWGKEKPFDGVDFNKDDPAHMQWVYEKAAEKAAKHDIEGVNLRFVQGVIKNIIAAVPMTNAIIAAACVLEAIKLATNQGPLMDNFANFQQEDGVSLSVVPLGRMEDCKYCTRITRRHTIKATKDITLEVFMKKLKDDCKLGKPTVGHEDVMIFFSMEDFDSPNMGRALKEFLPENGNRFSLHVCDDEALGPDCTLELELIFSDD